MTTSRHKLSAGRHLGAGRLVRLIQDLYVYVQPPTGDGGGDPECPWEGTIYEDDCCTGPSYDGAVPFNSQDYINTDEVYNRGSTAGFSLNVFGFGLINSTIPSHTQLFSENRDRLNNAANRSQSPCFIIGSDLSFAKYHPTKNVHTKIPSLSYDKVKKIYDSTPLLSLSSNAFISSLKTKENSGGVDFTHDAEYVPPTTKKTNIDVRTNLTGYRPDENDPYNRLPGDPPIEVCAQCRVVVDGNSVLICNLPNWDQVCGRVTVGGYDCCDCCADDDDPPVVSCVEGENCGQCKRCVNGACQDFPDCCHGDECQGVDCGACKTCEQVNTGESPGPGGSCVNCVPLPDPGCNCAGGPSCGSCQTCNPDTGECEDIVCGDGGFGDDGPTECCPGDSCGPEDCDRSQNQCCASETGTECVPCDICPDVLSYSYDSTGTLTSIEGNYRQRDLFVPAYFTHDMNQGLGGNQIVSSNDIIMSCQLELTVKNVYGKLAYVGAKPFCKTSQFNVYRVKQDVDPVNATKNEYSNGNSWTVPYGRHPDDVDVETKSVLTVSDQVKPLDKVYIDITAIAKQSQSDGIIRLMIEPKSYFSEISSDPSTALSEAGYKEEIANHPAMLLEFYQSGTRGPKINMNVHQGRRPVTQRRMPWQRTAV